MIITTLLESKRAEGKEEQVTKQQRVRQWVGQQLAQADTFERKLHVYAKGFRLAADIDSQQTETLMHVFNGFFAPVIGRLDDS